MIKAPAIITGVSSLRDGGLSVRLHTNELSVQQKAEIMGYDGQFGYFLFKENSEGDIANLEIPKDNAPAEGKSKSQILRGMLYGLFKAQKEAGDFEVWYRKEMDKFITHVRQNIEAAMESQELGNPSHELDN